MVMAAPIGTNAGWKKKNSAVEHYFLVALLGCRKVSKSALDIHGLGVCSSVIYAALHRPCL